EVIEATIAFMGGIQSPVERYDFEESIASGLGLTALLLESEFKSYKEKKNREALKRDYREFFKKGLRLIEAGDLQAFEEHLKESSTEFQIKTTARIPELYTASLLEEDIRRARPGLKTGYASLDDLFSIPPEAITIIGARPSHGKTTFLMNLALNMVKAVPDRSFFFFSYEESRRQIGVKFLNILSGHRFDSGQNIKCLEDMIRGDGQDQNNKAWEKIRQGQAELERLTESKRLWIIDEPYFVDELAGVLTLFKKQYDIGAVFIDYIQKIKIAGRYATRQMEIQKVSETILETAKKLLIPIILGAQLGRDPQHGDKVRLDNLREAGDIEQDANLVLGLFNPAMEKAQDNGETSREDTVDLQVTVLKNRNGPVNETRILNFIRPLLTIKDKSKGW
ncbi:MAG: DnaB-like helicase C-terminal domain-containing protein, partial [Candidatus Saccharicenans sp.]|nr:DnaB-like helicase C-terminal domain-containing protein [Candidatus Saccharicenans sp.]